MIDSDPGVVAAQESLVEAVKHWWSSQSSRLDALSSTADLVPLRRELMSSFGTAVTSGKMLDTFEVMGIVASWWEAEQSDLKALATLGYPGLVDAWISTVLDALEEEVRVNPLDHQVARSLLPDYLDGLAALERGVAELDSSIKTASSNDDGEDDDLSDSDVLSDVDIKQLKKELSAAKKHLKAEKAAFAQRLLQAGESIDDSSCRELVFRAFSLELMYQVSRRVRLQRETVQGEFETWWDKYQVTMRDLERECDSTGAELTTLLRELGYE
jgi:type I restriction enzyme M protein